MTEIPIDHCPKPELVKLPCKDVTTFDGKTLRLHDVVYFRFAPGEKASEYVVVTTTAIVCQGGYKILVVGSRGIPAGMNPKDFVKDVKLWWRWRHCREGMDGDVRRE